jgi:hypothetical protein
MIQVGLVPGILIFLNKRIETMLEDELVAKYATYGRSTPSDELYLPLFISKQFVDECTNLQIAIIGVDFFHIGREYVMPTSPLNGIDSSIFLKTATSWEDVVKQCNEAAMKVLQQEEKKDNTQWYNPTLFEKSEWQESFS